MQQNKKNISFKLDKDLHKQIKMKAITEGKNIKEYLLDLAQQDLRDEEVIVGKKLFEQWEIKKFIESFNGQKIINLNMLPCDASMDIRALYPTIEVSEEAIDFKKTDFHINVLFKAIKYIHVDETKEIASVTIYLQNNTFVKFTYKNI